MATIISLSGMSDSLCGHCNQVENVAEIECLPKHQHPSNGELAQKHTPRLHPSVVMTGLPASETLLLKKCVEIPSIVVFLDDRISSDQAVDVDQNILGIEGGYGS
jgi:hypothetical protein